MLFMMGKMYKEKRVSRSRFVPIRGVNYHLREWQAAVPSDLPPLVLVHGWMDVAASWQFMVDALSDAFAQGRTIIAPDWRGFGLTRYGDEATPHTGDYYWFADYLADLDFLLDAVLPDQTIDLIGHSMGGNIAMLYSGIQPQRIRKLVNLEGFGMPATKPADAPQRYAQWMAQLKTLHRGEMALKGYDDVAGVARRLMKTNPRLSQDKAEWLASHWAKPDANGQWLIMGDPAHKVASAQLYRADEAIEIFKNISAPVLSVEAADDSPAKFWKGAYTLADYHARLAHVPDARTAVIDDAGHMLQHDQPEQLARLVEDFLGG